MSEVRPFAEVVNVVRTRTLSAMGKSRREQPSCYENDVKSDNEMNASMCLEQTPVNSGIIECRVTHKVVAAFGSFMVLNVCSGKGI